MTGRCLACKRRMPLSEFWAHQSGHNLTDWTPEWNGVRVLWKPMADSPGDLKAVTIHPLIWAEP